DVNGEMHRLSALEGKVVLLDFWISNSHVSLMDNRELLSLYKEYHKKGFEVYQVSLDIDRASWVDAINQQKLPWINVSSLNGVNSVAAQSYLITELPANFLIDKKGEIVGKNLYGGELKKELAKLIKK
ncbi:MAG: TlpA family protein disulfide reductase, partial [Prevotellaceae bacterium]|nr:TlpA family protein disulfide reductase [Prevotellaceae bacterium]